MGEPIDIEAPGAPAAPASGEPRDRAREQERAPLIAPMPPKPLTQE
ncbi:MAG: hypothetical protein ACLGHP_06340 [Vicinamibacteria bacterium]